MKGQKGSDTVYLFRRRSYARRLDHSNLTIFGGHTRPRFRSKYEYLLSFCKSFGPALGRLPVSVATGPDVPLGCRMACVSDQKVLIRGLAILCIQQPFSCAAFRYAMGHLRGRVLSALCPSSFNGRSAGRGRSHILRDTANSDRQPQIVPVSRKFSVD